MIQRSTGSFPGQVGVEEVERHAADVDAPDVEGDGAAEQLELELERPAARPATSCTAGVRSGNELQPVLLLPAGAVEPLVEVAAAVEEADRRRTAAPDRSPASGCRRRARRARRSRSAATRGRRTPRRRTRPAPSRPGTGRGGRARSSSTAAASASIRSRSAPSAAARSARSSGRSESWRTGFRPARSQPRGSRSRKTSSPPACHDQR